MRVIASRWGRVGEEEIPVVIEVGWLMDTMLKRVAQWRVVSMSDIDSPGTPHSL